MTRLLNFTSKKSLEGFTLVIPTVSVGNVPQLTSDLLITSLAMDKVATIWHPALAPSVGVDPDRPHEVCTACELFTSDLHKFAVIQLRSSVNSRLAKKFFKQLQDELVGEEKIGKVIILASSFDHEVHVISETKDSYVSNDSEVKGAINNKLVKLNQCDDDGQLVIYGSGFAVPLYELLRDCVSCTILYKYISEGDNRPDAIDLLNVLLSQVLKIGPVVDVTIPKSWKGVFGGPPPIGIY